jgi:hypothetical protein
VAVFKFSREQAGEDSRPPRRRAPAVSLASQFPEIPIANIRVADAVLDDEASRPSY